MKGWIRVTRSNPCIVCGKPDNCQVSEDGTWAYCGRIADGSIRENAGGQYLHRLTEDTKPRELPTQKEPPKRLSIEEVTRRAMGMYESAAAPEMRRKTAERLGVAEWALEALYVGYSADRNGKEFSSWPSRDEHGDFIGIVRRYEDGSKKTLAGTSNAGVFCCERWWTPPGEIWLVEGGSDTAACITHAIAAIGRPSNRGGAKTLAAMLQPHERPIVVWGEQDRKWTCPAKCASSCPACWPGLHGAQAVQQELQRLLGRSVSVRMPRGKDVRCDLRL